MVENSSRDKLSVYVPLTKKSDKLVERLQALAKKKDRSTNYLVVQAILEYLEREERKSSRS